MERIRVVRVLMAVLATSFVPAAAIANPFSDRSWPRYFAVKTVMQGFYDDDREQRQRLRDHSEYDLANCENGAQYTGGDTPTVTAAFADIAFDVIVWREAFRRFGYPTDIWQPAIVAYEQSQVNRAIAMSTPRFFAYSSLDASDPGSSTIASLKRKLNAYRSAHPALPQIVEGGGCGAGGASVSIATVPLASEVMFIPTFFYQLCKVQKQNADDPNGCPQWREALAGKLESVAGDYMYFARWRDGSVRRGKLSFDIEDDGHTITLRKP